MRKNCEEAMKDFYYKYEDVDMDVVTTLIDHEYVIHIQYFPPTTLDSDYISGYSIKLRVNQGTDPDELYNKLMECRENLIKMHEDNQNGK